MTLVTYFVQRFFFDDCLLSITYDTWKNKNKNKFKKKIKTSWIHTHQGQGSFRQTNEFTFANLFQEDRQ